MPEDDDKLSDAELFRSAIGPVKPIKSTPRIKPSSSREKLRPKISEHTVAEGVLVQNRAEDLAAVSVHDPLYFAHSGVQGKLLKRLKTGRLNVDDCLDLHGLYQAEAEQALLSFLMDQYNFGHRCLLVIHGKGLHGDERWPVLKNMTHRVLRQSSVVLAFCSAQPKDGGLGAVYVLLRRSSEEN